MNSEKEAQKLFDNRLMQTDEEITQFEEAMNLLYEVEDIENIKYFCKAFDDNTHEPPVMFSLVHGIEHYDNIFGKEKATSKFLDSIQHMLPLAPEWLETMILRNINHDESRTVLIEQLKDKNDEIKNIVREVINKLIKRKPRKFEQTGNEVLTNI